MHGLETIIALNEKAANDELNNRKRGEIAGGFMVPKGPERARVKAIIQKLFAKGLIRAAK